MTCSFPFDSDAVELIFLQSEDSARTNGVWHDADMRAAVFFDIDSLGS